jgi:cytochrome c5
MTKSSMCRSAAALVAMGFTPLLAQAPTARAQAAGDLWEVTQQMTMEGMPMKMPASTMKVCAAKQWTKPPGGDREGCTSSGYAQSGNTVTWTTMCTGRQSMAGRGEVTRDSDDHYKGAIKFMGDGFAMTVQLEGKRVGECDNPQ